MIRRVCAAPMAGGRSCGSPPLRDGTLCAFHDPAHRDEAQEARRLGGLRRRREIAVSGAYDFTGLATAEDLRRLLEVAAFDALGMETSISRARVIVAIVLAGAKLLEVTELEERLRVLEDGARLRWPDSAPPPFALARDAEADSA